MSSRLIINGRSTEANSGASLFELAESLDVHVPTSCQKQGKCRECLVEIESGAELLSPSQPQEEHLPEGFRLSCRAHVVAEEGEVHCHTLRRGELRIEEASSGLDASQIAPEDYLYRRRDGLLYRAGEAIGPVEGAVHGVAIDLGTTTVVLRLVDLESGRPVATQSFENPQRFGGSDIMARIRYDTDHPGRLLQRVLLGYLRRALRALPCESESIFEIAVAGNPTMRDLLFGLDVHSIGQLPYLSITEAEVERGERETTSLEVAAASLRLPAHPAARLYSLPLLGRHVGADAAACLLATGIGNRHEVAMCMDIGTNSEVLIGDGERLLVASCPAGPAFEGGGVLCGVPGLEGAIERVRLGEAGVETDVIGNGDPIGICGSGLVDLLSELLRTGQMNAQGRFTEEIDTFSIDAEHNIVLTEPDINELAQAKGANAAGLRITADRFGVPLGEIDHFYLAGGFGRHIDPQAAQRIGLIPQLEGEKLIQVGNAALAGTMLALCSLRAREEIERLARNVEHVQLELHPLFFDFFVDGCQFESFGGGAPE
jgi:uncharacterized 2Fe-2S/4Fe-4S cluster protein (DUF4445 family)